MPGTNTGNFYIAGAVCVLLGTGGFGGYNYLVTKRKGNEKNVMCTMNGPNAIHTSQNPSRKFYFARR